MSDTKAGDALDRAYQALLKARLNVIYFEKLGERYELWDKSLRIGSLVLSSGGVVSLLAWVHIPALALTFGALSAVLSAIQLVGGFAERVRGVAALLPQYVAHYAALKRLFEQGEEIDTKALGAALAGLDQVAVGEAEKFRAPDESLRNRAYALLMTEIGYNDQEQKYAA